MGSSREELVCSLNLVNFRVRLESVEWVDGAWVEDNARATEQGRRDGWQVTLYSLLGEQPHYKRGTRC